MLKVQSFDRSSLSIDFHCSVHSHPALHVSACLLFKLNGLASTQQRFRTKYHQQNWDITYPKTQQSQRIWCKPPILLSSGRRWSRTEAFGEVAGQDRGEARWGQDRGQCFHSIVFGIWESVFRNWGVFGGIELNLRPRRSSMRVILQLPNGQQDICSRHCIDKK